MAVIKEHGIYFLTGSLRSGKGLTAVSKLQEVLLDGRKVATNMDLKLENLLPANNKTANVLRLPDHPIIDDLEAIGLGYDHDDPEHYDESKFGLLVLDELATFLNARNWNDKNRKKFIDWLLMSGKKRWILMLTIQDMDLLDSQIKKALGSQYIVHCKSLSKYSVPLISPIFKLIFGRPLTLPKSYLGVVKIGTDSRATVNDRWFHSGTSLYKCYNTAQVYLDRDHSQAVMLSSMLTPWHIKGRFLPVKDLAFYRAYIKDNIEYGLLALIVTFFFSLLSIGFSVFNFTSDQSDRFIQLQEQLTKLQQNQKNSHASVISSSIPMRKIEQDKCLDFDSMYENVFIEGNYSTDRGMAYLLTDGSNRVRSTQLMESGVRLKTSGKCSFTLIKNECSHDFYCSRPFAGHVDRAAGDMTGKEDESQEIQHESMISQLVQTAL